MLVWLLNDRLFGWVFMVLLSLESVERWIFSLVGGVASCFKRLRAEAIVCSIIFSIQLRSLFFFVLYGAVCTAPHDFFQTLRLR